VSSKSNEDSSTVEALLSHNADVHALDNNGNSCLHYASTWGNLKAVRVLIQAGADPLQRNGQGWVPQYYSITVQAEVYYRNLVVEWEKRKAEDAARVKERRGKGGGGLRLVEDEENEQGRGLDGEEARVRAESMESIASSGTGKELRVSLRRNDTWK
jgi:Ankyrin repeats (many copies)